MWDLGLLGWGPWGATTSPGTLFLIQASSHTEDAPSLPLASRSSMLSCISWFPGILQLAQTESHFAKIHQHLTSSVL